MGGEGENKITLKSNSLLQAVFLWTLFVCIVTRLYSFSESNFYKNFKTLPDFELHPEKWTAKMLFTFFIWPTLQYN